MVVAALGPVFLLNAAVLTLRLSVEAKALARARA
jgi:hypothetical protein